MSHNVDKAAFVKGEPWWLSMAPDRGVNLGDKEVTSKQMLEGAGLGWTVECRDVFADIGDDNKVLIAGKKAIVRSDTHEIFSVQSDRWEPVQNTDAFTFFDAVIGSGPLYHSAGSLGRGEKVWILVKLPRISDIAGDKVEQYILLANSHDGTAAFTFQQTGIRVVCQNTLNFALGAVESAQVYRKFHLSGVTGRLDAEDARNIIGLSGAYFEEFERVGQELAAAKMTAKDLNAFLESLFPVKALPAPQAVAALPAPDKSKLMVPISPIVIKRREEVKDFIVAGAGNTRKAIKGTRWAAVNGVAEWVDFKRGKDETRAKGLLFGTGRTIKQKAFDLLRS